MIKNWGTFHLSIDLHLLNPQALMHVNARLLELYPDDEERFDIVLMTNNHAQVGVRLINSINHYGKGSTILLRRTACCYIIKWINLICPALTLMKAASLIPTPIPQRMIFIFGCQHKWGSVKQNLVQSSRFNFSHGNLNFWEEVLKLFICFVFMPPIHIHSQQLFCCLKGILC